MDSDAELRELLRRVHTIAVVGMKGGAEDDAFRVPRYMQARGYRVLPVNPKLDAALGERAVARLADIGEPIDLVNLFRAPEHVPLHAQEVLRLSHPPRAVWMQLGIRHEEAARRLQASGIAVVQSRCLMVEHRRLLGP